MPIEDAGRILYIGGAAHSGSTLLDVMLGEAPNAVSLGQAGDIHVFHGTTRQCSCRADIKECVLWGDILARVPDEAFDQMSKLGPQADKEKQFLRFIFSSQLCKAYANAFDPLFDAAFAATGASVLIDSSKNLSRGAALLKSSRHPVRFLHLIRDGRGYINSVYKRRKEEDKGASAAPIFAKWLAKNASASVFVRRVGGARYLAVNYEDLLNDPVLTLDRISDFSGLDLEDVKRKALTGEPFSQKHMFRANRISWDADVRFDPAISGSNRLKKPSNNAFWYLGGWTSRFWGYDKDQSYLKP